MLNAWVNIQVNITSWMTALCVAGAPSREVEIFKKKREEKNTNYGRSVKSRNIQFKLDSDLTPDFELLLL